MNGGRSVILPDHAFIDAKMQAGVIGGKTTVGWLKKGGSSLRSSSKRSFHKAGLGDTVPTFERINKSIKLEK